MQESWHKILSLQGEKLLADSLAIDPFKKILQHEIGKRGLTLEQLNNCDETRLYYRMLPCNTLASRDKRCRRNEEAEGSSNTNGMLQCNRYSQIATSLIGKSENPRCFRHVNKDAYG